MSTKSLNIKDLARRAAMMLLLALMTTATAWAQGSVSYRVYNASTNQFEDGVAASPTAVTEETTAMSDGWYVVSGNVNVSGRIEVTGTVNLILCDGATLTATQGLHVPTGVTLNIYGQSDGTGGLTATQGGSDQAGIGGNNLEASGTITIHGGNVTSTGGWSGAGIGGGHNQPCGSITIYGGTVNAHGGDRAAGIGGGTGEYSGGTITIMGGTVTAWANTYSDYDNSQAIGVGMSNNPGTSTLFLGDVKVYNSSSATTPVALTDRESTCRSKYVRLTTCDHHYVNNECTYCGAEQNFIPIPYLVYDTESECFVQHTANVATYVKATTTTMGVAGSETFYAVKNDVTVSSRLEVLGTVHLILCDGKTLTATGGITVHTGNTLNIHGQEGGTGAIVATSSGGNNAAIGTLAAHYNPGTINSNCGTINFHGGTITATGGAWSAAIGGGVGCGGGTINIYGGTVTATSTDGAGIGGGYYGSGGTVTIYGGTVTATGGDDGAGIGGGGFKGNGGTVTIHGGTVTATSTGGAGIGGGYYGNGDTVTIYGGTVTATSTDGAGIGGGSYQGNGGTVTIYGGTVTATSNKGAGIGTCKSGSGGTLNLGDMRVYASAKATTPVASGNRVSTCRSKYAKLESCTDHNSKNGYCTYCDAHVILANNDAEAAVGEKNTDVISTWNGTETDIILQDRTLYKDGDWNTLCLPFDVTIAGSVLDGADVRALDNADLTGGVLTLNFTNEGDVTTIEAGKPYIIRWAKAEGYVDDDDHNLVNPVFRNVTVKSDMNNFESTDGKVSFCGTYDYQRWDAENPSILFLGAENQLHWPDADASLGACRAYFQLTEGAGVREFKLSFGDDTQTIIGHTEITEGLARRPEGESQITEKADAWYTVNGVKLSGMPRTRGIYVKNGKKIVVK